MIDFTKLQAIGNDFLVMMVEDVARSEHIPALARKICDRNFGAGGDGLIIVDQKGTRDAQFSSRIFNCDGTEAEISGNGTRCVAAYLMWAGLSAGPEIAIATKAGIKRGALVAREGLRFDFAFDMGKPELHSDRIPVILGDPSDTVVDRELDVNGEKVRVTAVSMGNPHCAVFVSDLSDGTFSRLGPLLESHPGFPNHTNVEFIRTVSESEIEVRVWERGVGPTLSSGTGSCASTVASVLNGRTSRNVTVHTAGGDLHVLWRDDGTLLLTAAAVVVFRGQWLAN